MSKHKAGAAGIALTVPFNKLIAPPDNVRSDLTELDELAASIKEVGLLQPITVEQNEAGGYVITSGFRRHAAIGQLIAAREWTGPVPVHVREWVDETQRLVAMLIENLQRVDLDPVDEAFGIQRLAVEYGIDLAEISTRVGRTPALVKERLMLCSLPDEAIALVRAGSLTLATAATLATAPEAVIAKVLKNETKYLRPADITKLVVQHERNELMKQLVKALKAHDLTRIQGASYNTPRGYVGIGQNTTVHSLEEFETAITLSGAGLGCVCDLTPGYDTLSVHVRFYMKSGIADPDQETPEEREARLEQQERERIDTGLPPDAQAWYAQCMAVTDAANARQMERQQLADAIRPLFHKQRTTKDVAADLLALAAQSTASDFHYALRNSYHADKALRTALSLGFVADDLDELQALSRDEMIAKLTATAKMITRAASVYIERTSINAPAWIDYVTQAAEEAGCAHEAVVYPPVPESLAIYADPDAELDANEISEICEYAIAGEARFEANDESTNDDTEDTE